MQRFALRQNIALFRSHMETETDAQLRRILRQLLLEAQRDLALLEADTLGALTDAPIDSAGFQHSTAAPLLAGAFQREFAAAPQPYLLIDPRPGLHIVDANDAYAQVTLTNRHELAGRKLFDVFPDNPADRDADGVRTLHASLCRVMATRRPHHMAVQRYDVRDARSEFVERYWRPVNTPLFDETGAIVHILHHAEPVAESAPRSLNE